MQKYFHKIYGVSVVDWSMLTNEARKDLIQKYLNQKAGK